MSGERGDLWARFVASGVEDSRRLVAALDAVGLDRLTDEDARAGLRGAAYLAFSIATQALLMGAEPVGRLALAAERLLDHVLAGEVVGETTLPFVASACHTLAQAFDVLANPDRSGARVEGLPLEAARYELETLVPGPGGRAGSATAPDVPVTSLRRGADSTGVPPDGGESGSRQAVRGGDSTGVPPDGGESGSRQAVRGGDSTGVPPDGGESGSRQAVRGGDSTGVPPDGGESGSRQAVRGKEAPAGAAGAGPARPGAPPVLVSVPAAPRSADPNAPPPVSRAAAPPVQVSRSPESGPAAPEPSTWTPTVDDDMVELFFAEVHERLEALAIKLVDVEGRPDDAELLRDVFRDLHTIKGSSAMVGLRPMNDLAHAAEDLVGRVREGVVRAERPVIDALLATLDVLRDVAGRASRRETIDIDPGPLVRRLRDPRGALPAPTTALPPATDGAAPPAFPPPSAPADPAAALAQSGRQTIRVDFDKLDQLLNLVGELVLGRDSLRSSLGAISSLGNELSSDRQLARRLETMADLGGAQRVRRSDRRVAGAVLALPDPRASAAGLRPAAAAALTELREELGRVERVLGDIASELDGSSTRLDAVSGELREAVMRLRMVPVGGVMRKHHRTVRDLANALGKRARVVLAGEDTELDKLLVEALDEPLLHLVRNAVDHGFELPEARAASGKPPEGTLHIRATQRGNQVVIEVSDDGRGISPAVVRRRARERGLVTADELEAMDDREVLDLIFRPGFSTAEVVSDVSGRGVGMDVVRQTIVHRLKGSIDIRSTVGQGSAFTLSLPLTLAITQVLLARAGGEVLAVPLDAVVRTLAVDPGQIRLVQEREVLTVRDRQVPLVRLAEVLELGGDDLGAAEQCVILTEQGGDMFGLACEGLLAKKEIVIKSLGDLLRHVPCAAGATLLGDRCALILDVPAVIARALAQRRTGGGARARHAARAASAAVAQAPHILLVEDSDVVRESLRRLLAEAGYRVTAARDGVEGLAEAQAQRFDLVSTDVMMPRMDGYELTRALRASAEYRDVPVVMVTSRGERIDRVRGFDAGVDEYITKPHDRHLLLKAVARLLGERGRKERGS